MSVLRVYDPAECDERGVPLDWERCRTCGGMGNRALDWRGADVMTESDDEGPCEKCGGHGSLKAAALALSRRTVTAADLPAGPPAYRARLLAASTVRCEDCGHPMSEGTWEGKHDAWSEAKLLDVALYDLRHGFVPKPEVEDGCIHYSRCDEGCRHGGPVRGQMWPGMTDPPPPRPIEFTAECPDVATWTRYMPVEASWRQVDGRTLGWPLDLRPEKLAVLCLRCWAARPALADPNHGVVPAGVTP